MITLQKFISEYSTVVLLCQWVPFMTGLQLPFLYADGFADKYSEKTDLYRRNTYLQGISLYARSAEVLRHITIF